MSNARHVLRREAESLRPSPDWISEVTRRVERRRRQRRVRSLLVAAALSGVTVWIGARAFLPSAPTRPAAQQTGTYIFTDVSVISGSAGLRPGMVDVEFSVQWSSESFPGVHECTWTVYGPAGETVGVHRDEFIALNPRDGGLEEVEVVGEAVRASASCDPNRIDIGDPYRYVFDVSRVEPTVQGRDETPVWELDVKPMWQGEGFPGVVLCDVHIHGPSGAVHAEQNLTWTPSTLPDGGPLSFLRSEIDPGPGPFEARFACKPYGGLGKVTTDEP